MNHNITANMKWEDSVDLLLSRSRAFAEAGDFGDISSDNGDKAQENGSCPRNGFGVGLMNGEQHDGHAARSSSKEIDISHQPSVQTLKGPRVNALTTAQNLGSFGREDDQVLDMICIGFGPASLAIGIALADAYSAVPQRSLRVPKILFLEKQESFAWHAGMQLPEAKMQISFLKDLATPRDPTSPFSFTNYLHSQGRLNQFINLGTFLPSRLEYEDYMRWCAEHFKNSVMYGQEVEKVEHGNVDPATGRADSFTVTWKDIRSYSASKTTRATARHVVVATGGRPYLPKEFQAFSNGKWPRVRHSSQFATTVRQWEELIQKKLAAERLHTSLWEEGDLVLKQHNERMREVGKKLPKSNLVPGGLSNGDHVDSKDPFQVLETETKNKLIKLKADLDIAETALFKAKDLVNETGVSGGAEQRFVVFGSGQSAVEIFNDLWTRYPEAYVSLIIKGAALRPSDDSPFVNEIFDPERIDGIYSQDAEERAQALQLDRGTNYGVVRLTLLDHIYEKLYVQRIKQPDAKKRKAQIITNRVATSVEQGKDGNLVIKLGRTNSVGKAQSSAGAVEEVIATHAFVATGYLRNAHEEILKDTIDCLPAGRQDGHFPVGRDYKVLYDKEKVADNCGVWLQGCNESTHGLADSLLSVLAVRGGEIINSIFSGDIKDQTESC